MNAVFFYAFLALGLLLDGAFLFRLVLFAVFIHESAHIIMYITMTKKLPKISLSVGGVCLNKIACLKKRQKTAVLLAGPLTNIIVCVVFYSMALNKASYFAYIFSAVNLCVGLYNLLPIGALDGAQIAECFLPGKYIMKWAVFQRSILIILTVFLPIIAYVLGFSPVAFVAAVIAPVYLLLQNFL